jgi:hypothetical protein
VVGAGIGMARAVTTAASFRQTGYRVALLRESPVTRLAKTLRLQHRRAKSSDRLGGRDPTSAVLASPLAGAVCVALAGPSTDAPGGDRACAIDDDVKHA